MSEDLNRTTPDLIEEKEPSSFTLIIALGIAGLISGIILVGTFLYTNPMIIANKKAATQRAIFEVLPGCETYTLLKLENGQIIENVDLDDNKDETDKDELLIYAGYNSQKELIGFAIPGSETGYQDVIAVMFGYDYTQKLIIGFEVLESKETPGLGDKIFKDADFQTNFTALAVEPEIVAVKNGQKINPNEVDGITGATISSEAVVRLLNKTIDIWKDSIDEYIKENDLNDSDANE